MKFIESIHKYIDEGIDYTPVTYILKKFQEYVDWQQVAEKKAKKDGVTKEELLAQWDKKKNDAAARGTAFHKMKEAELRIGSFVLDENEYPVRLIDTIDDVKEDLSMILEDNTIYAEKMIWSKKFRVCGTADIVEVLDGKINIKDYKTNEKLDMASWKHPTKGTKRLKYPLTHLDDCNFNLYQLQINMYMYMLLQQNRTFKIGNMQILHIVFDTEDPNKYDTKIYPVKNLQREVKSMLETYRK